MNAYDVDYYSRVVALKSRNPSLQVYISVGGWAAGGAIFSSMVGTSIHRQAFIQSAISLMNTYAFDGIDIDWEYPAAGDRGGVAADTANFVQFLPESRAACGRKFGITVTLPSSYCKDLFASTCALSNLLPSQGTFRDSTSSEWSNMLTGSIL